MTAPVITAWSALSPAGTGATAFRDAVLGSGQVPSRSGADQPVPGYEVTSVLGRKGTRAMDRATALAVTAVRDLLDAEPGRRERATGPAAGLVLGTTLGSAASAMHITRDSLTQSRPFFVDAARVPNAIMNCPAGQSAIRERLRGPNTTVAGGRAATLLGLRYARRLLDNGRADTVLVGAVEECSPERALLASSARPAGAADRPLAEGSAILLLEGRANAPRQEIKATAVAVESGVHGDEDDGDEDAADRIARCLRRTLSSGGITPSDLWAVSSVPAPGALGRAEEQALRAALATSEPVRVGLPGWWGDTGAVTAAFQIASLIVAAERDGVDGAYALVVSADPDGLHASALLRMGGGA